MTSTDGPDEDIKPSETPESAPSGTPQDQNGEPPNSAGNSGDSEQVDEESKESFPASDPPANY